MASSPFFSSPFVSPENTIGENAIGENAIGEQRVVESNKQNGSHPLMRLSKDRDPSLSAVDDVSPNLESGDLRQIKGNGALLQDDFDPISGSPNGMVPSPESRPEGSPLLASETTGTDSVTALDLLPVGLGMPPAENRDPRKSQDLFAALAFASRSFKNLNQVLELTTFVASQLTDADGSALVMFEPNGTLRLEQIHCADMGRREQIRSLLEGSTQSLSREITSGEDFAIGPPATLVLAEETLDYGAWLEHVLDRQLQQDLGSGVYLRGTPLLMRSTVRGRLYVFSHQSSYRWTEDRQQLLRLVADQSSVAIENDELTASLRRKAALDRELEIGSEIQSQLLPRSFPRLAGIQFAARCKTASQVGGDYYDFIEIKTQPGSPSRVGIVIGDVMGKGVPAGLLMTTMRGMLRAEVLNDHRPARILHHLNHVMYADLEQAHRFISLFYSDYDPASGHLCFSNAAHNPTLLWRATTQELDYLDTPGQLLGLEPDGQFEELCVQLQPGDVVVYYTDGFTEAANARGERLETTGLESAVRYAALHFEDPQAILECLFDQVERFRQTAQARQRASSSLWSNLTEDELRLLPNLELQGRLMATDDMTLVVMKVSAA
jgi:sigma-B regulation protein RsbU (phosphoserine phosphatase)